MSFTPVPNALSSALRSTACNALASQASAAVAFAQDKDVLAAHPKGQRKFYRFSEGGYSNCNLYWIADKYALNAAEVFRSGGQFAKHPMRIISAFGFMNLLRFRLGLGTLAQAFERFSGRFGIKIAPIILADGAVAIDVDNERAFVIAEELLQQRSRVNEFSERRESAQLSLQSKPLVKRSREIA